LISMRQIAGEDHNHFGVTRIVNCHGTFYLGNRGQDYLFPLYLYDDHVATSRAGSGAGVTMALFEDEKSYRTRRPNFAPAFLKALAEKLALPQERPYGLPKGVSPEDVLQYAYAIFHSPTYRTRYRQFLRSDCPRPPL